MTLRLLLVACCLSAVPLAGPGLAFAQQPEEESLYLDSNDPLNDGDAGPVQTSRPLASGRFYTILVSGTFTAYSPSLWGNDPSRSCGAPDPSPTTPSPGREPAPAGHDAEFIYGIPFRRFCPPLPRSYYGFTIDVGQGWLDYEPSGGAPSQPTPDHTYTYVLQGNDVPARFRIVDSQSRDNNGILAITVRPATRGECAGNNVCENATPDQPPPPPPPPFQEAPPSATGGLPSTRRCLSRRRFKIHILNPRRSPLRAVAVTVAGRGVPVRRTRKRGRRYFVAVVDLRGRSRGKVRVKIVTRSRAGRIGKSQRVYRVCLPARRPRRA